MSSRRRAFILDFDGTVTTKDTISTIFKISVSVQACRGEHATVIRDNILSEYSEDYSKHVNNCSPAKEDRKTLAEEVKYYQSLHGVENRSFERVSRSRIFSGISHNDWEVSGRSVVSNGEVAIREGFREFIETVERSGDSWGVVSVNFSSHFIRGVLTGAGVESSNVDVLANQAGDDGIIQGPETREVMTTSDAKLAAMKAMLNTWRSRARGQFSKIIYLGDSGTDIECLTEEGTTGVVIAADRKSSLIETLNRVGVDVKHIDVYRDGREATVYWARNFKEILSNSDLMSQQISE
ncbi:hypothetical protein N431DRAFT_424928 [Stipitochalara longipes BDJ]|nr:hypothetical protein N431DRAFT_424928 [Stipitochalara longipes BDJ]